MGFVSIMKTHKTEVGTFLYMALCDDTLILTVTALLGSQGR